MSAQINKFKKILLSGSADILRSAYGILLNLKEDLYEKITGEAGIKCKVDYHCHTRYVGYGDGRWNICPDNLNSNSIVYSVGVGRDISFDLELIRKFSCNVYAFDPTPISIEWLKTQALPNNFKFNAVGLANFDGYADFILPEKHSVSFSMKQGVEGQQKCHRHVSKLATLMKDNDHMYIDLLKIDIEGAEYDIINDICEHYQQIGQVLIEFHDRLLPPELHSASELSIDQLRKSGFKIFSSKRGKSVIGFLGNCKMSNQNFLASSHSKA